MSKYRIWVSHSQYLDDDKEIHYEVGNPEQVKTILNFLKTTNNTFIFNSEGLLYGVEKNIKGEWKNIDESTLYQYSLR